MSALVIVLFALACLLALTSAPLAFALSASLFSIKQLLQASAGIFRDSLFGSQAVNFIIGGVAALSTIRLVASNPSALTGYVNRTWLVTVSLFLWALATCAWSLGQTQGLSSLGSGAPFILMGIILLPMLISEVGQVARMMPIWLLLATCVSALILVNPEFTVRDGRLVLDLGIAGLKVTRSNPLELGMAGGICVLLGLLYSSERRPVAVNILRVFAVLIGTALAVRSGSRGQFVLALVAGVVCYPLARPIVDVRRTITGLATLILLLVVIYFLAQRVRTSGGLLEEQRWDASGFASGAEGRFNNISMLLGEYARSPTRWLGGLGYLSFSYLNPSEEYTHCLSADMLGELGVVGVFLYGYLVLRGVVLSRQVLSEVANEPRYRNPIGCFIALVLYLFLLANKQGNLSSSFLLFGMLLILARVHESLLNVPTQPIDQQIDGTPADLDASDDLAVVEG